jgi:anti-sigma B factor antagonist
MESSGLCERAGEKLEGVTMQLTSSYLLDVPLLEVAGEIDHSTAPILQEAINQELDSGCRLILIDLTAVDYIDSGGIAVLLAAMRRVRSTGWVGVIQPTDVVRRLLDMVGLTIDRGFRAFADRDEAVEGVLGHLPTGSGLETPG